MSWRTVVISKSAKLDYQLGYMVVRQETVSKVHLSELSVLIIESTAVSLTCALLSELTKKKVKVIFCDEKKEILHRSLFRTTGVMIQALRCETR